MSLDPVRLASVHARLLGRDPSASADLFELVYGPLIGHGLKRHGPLGLDREQAEHHALNVVANLIERPEQFDDTKGNLFGFLCMAFDGDVMNASETSKARARKFSEHAIEVQEVGGNWYSTTPEVQMDAQRIMERHGSEIIVDDCDEAVLTLLLLEERDYATYARALGIDHLPPNERDAEVKRRKDRIEARLKRLGRRL